MGATPNALLGTRVTFLSLIYKKLPHNPPPRLGSGVGIAVVTQSHLMLGATFRLAYYGPVTRKNPPTTETHHIMKTTFDAIDLIYAAAEIGAELLLWFSIAIAAAIWANHLRVNKNRFYAWPLSVFLCPPLVIILWALPGSSNHDVRG